MGKERPGILFNILHCTGQPSTTKNDIWPKMSIVLRLRNPGLDKLYIYIYTCLEEYKYV